MMYSCCGLNCEKCEAYEATVTNDDVARERIAKEWSARYGADIRPGGINCRGCRAEGDVHFAYCGMCEIRKCVLGRSLENCADCSEYCCDRLADFLQVADEAKENLEVLRKRG